MEYLKKAIEQDNVQEDDTRKMVAEIISNIKNGGDEEIKEYEKKLSKSTRELFRVSDKEIEESINSLSKESKELIDRNVERISSFAEAQLNCITPLDKEFGDGIEMGHRVIPIKKVGAYVPGGRFPLLSSGPMTVAPAKVAGAEKIVVCSPASYNDSIHPAVLYGLIQSGATEIYAIGGAQAIASMAYGTESVSNVDIIVGPGNRFVAEAKRQVFGKVGIDLIAGPSEVLVFADETANSRDCAADLLAQAEHDPNARAILVTTSKNFAIETMTEIDNLLSSFTFNSPAHDSWNNMGEVVTVDSINEGVDLCNDYAIEHLHLHLKNSDNLIDSLYNYGSLFIGKDSSVVFSDKVSGTNHTLPTQKAARYTGGLWVGNFVKILTHQKITGEGVNYLASHATKQSKIEGLEGHKLSASLRLSNK